MSVAPHIQEHLNHKGVYYELLSHPHSLSSLETARLARVPPEQVAKGVLTHDGENYLLCVIPSNHRLSLPWLNRVRQGHFPLVSEHREPDSLHPGQFHGTHGRARTRYHQLRRQLRPKLAGQTGAIS